MSQHDYVLNNATGASFRSDSNNAMLAIASMNSGASEPSTKYAYMFWADTASGYLKQRNAANNAWISLWEISAGPASFPTGTKMYFYQAAAPTGWTIQSSVGDRVLAVVDPVTTTYNGQGAGTTTSDWTISGITTNSHTHTMSSHAHSLQSHTHTMSSHYHSFSDAHTHAAGSHTHGGPSHNHQWYIKNITSQSDQSYTSGGAAVDFVKVGTSKSGNSWVLSQLVVNITNASNISYWTSNASGTTGGGTGNTGNGTASGNTGNNNNATAGPSNNTSGTNNSATATASSTATSSNGSWRPSAAIGILATKD